MEADEILRLAGAGVASPSPVRRSSEPPSDTVPSRMTRCFSLSPQLVWGANDLPGTSLVVSLLADKLSWSWLSLSPYDDLVLCVLTKLGSVTATN